MDVSETWATFRIKCDARRTYVSIKKRNWKEKYIKINWNQLVRHREGGDHGLKNGRRMIVN